MNFDYNPMIFPDYLKDSRKKIILTKLSLLVINIVMKFYYNYIQLKNASKLLCFSLCIISSFE